MEDYIDTVHRLVERNHVRMGETSEGDRDPYSSVGWMDGHCLGGLRDKDFGDF